jgi:hypothetical protein
MTDKTIETGTEESQDHAGGYYKTSGVIYVCAH